MVYLGIVTLHLHMYFYDHVYISRHTYLQVVNRCYERLQAKLMDLKPRTQWVERGNGRPKDRDEDKRREV